jgi:hypothetical protein
MQTTLFDSPKYKTFIQDRDRALEKIHLNTQTDLSRILSELLIQVEKELAHLLLFVDPQNVISLANTFEQESLPLFHSYVAKFVNRIRSMRRAVYLLTYLGEQEAIGRATKKAKAQTEFDLKRKIKDAMDAQTILDNDLTQQVWGAVMKLRGRILDRFRSSLLTDTDPKEIMAKVKKAFPEKTIYKRPPRELKPFREADRDPKDKLEWNYDFAPQEDWDLAVQAYKDTELPANRFDNDPQYEPESGYMRYNWELEQNATDDFVQQVRTGQVDAANELGIKEFVWVAVIDDRTDECCLQRAGKTTGEIEKLIESGKIDGDLCDAITPPAHPNCRCQLAPVSSTDEVEGPDWKSFNEWLDT